MPKVLAYEAHIRGGVTADNKLVVPRLATDPVAPGDGSVWFNTTDNVLRYRAAGVTINVNEVTLDAEGVRDVVGAALRGGNHVTVAVNDAADTITLDVANLTSANISDFIAAVRGAVSGGTTATAATTVTAATGVITVGVTDSPLLGGNTPAFYRNVDNHVDGTTNHVFTAADDTKLAGIQAGATANATDATLLARANHTGTQLASTISDFTAAVDTLIDGVNSPTATTTVSLVTIDPGTPLDPADDFQRLQVRTAVTDSPLLGGNAPAYYTNPDNHVDGTVNHVFTAADDTKLAGIQAGATANSTDAFLLARGNHTGTQTAATISDFAAAARAAITVTDTATADLTYTAAGDISVTVLDSPTVGGRSAGYLTNTDNHVDGLVNHVFTAADDTKLTGIQAGATANSTDAFLLARANHTGTQLASTISDLNAAVGAMTIDAATLNGSTRDQIQTAITAAIVDAAPGTLDTLNELAAALGDDPNFATTITNALNKRSRNFAAALTGGAATEIVTHNLNTQDVVVQVYNATGTVFEQEDYLIQHTSVNTITVVAEGMTIPLGRRVVIHAVGT